MNRSARHTYRENHEAIVYSALRFDLQPNPLQCSMETDKNFRFCSHNTTDSLTFTVKGGYIHCMCPRGQLRLQSCRNGKKDFCLDVYIILKCYFYKQYIWNARSHHGSLAKRRIIEYWNAISKQCQKKLLITLTGWWNNSQSYNFITLKQGTFWCLQGGIKQLLSLCITLIKYLGRWYKYLYDAWGPIKRRLRHIWIFENTRQFLPLDYLQLSWTQVDKHYVSVLCFQYYRCNVNHVVVCFSDLENFGWHGPRLITVNSALILQYLLITNLKIQSM